MALDARSNTQDANGNIAVRVVPATPAGGAPSGVVLQDPSGTAIVQPYPVNLQTAAGVEINFANPATGTVTRISGSAGVQTILGSSPGRKGGVVVNEATVTLYLKAGTGATATDYTWALPGGVSATLEVPFGYTGTITGFPASGNVTAQATSFS